jgi:glycine cleavage system H protein
MAEIGGYNMPDELYYHSEHAWVKVEDGKARVGMNDMFQGTSGDIVYVDLPFEGDEIEAGEVCGKIQSAKWIGKLVAPVSGEIVEINEELENDSTLINKDPYGKGWIVLIEPGNLDADLGNLMQGDAVREWLEAEFKRAEELKAQGGSEGD